MPALRVTVAVRPFLLRSSLHAALASDDRFEVSLCPLDGEPVSWAQNFGSQVLVVSEPVRAADMCVVMLSHAGDTVAFSNGDECRQLTYDGMSAFSDELAAASQSLIPAGTAG